MNGIALFCNWFMDTSLAARFLEVTTDIIYIWLHNLQSTLYKLFLKQHKITITFKKIHLSKLLAYYILK